jgi:hypothetical protein
MLQMLHGDDGSTRPGFTLFYMVFQISVGWIMYQVCVRICILFHRLSPPHSLLSSEHPPLVSLFLSRPP